MIGRDETGPEFQMDGIDVMRLAYLVGDLVRPVESVETRRRLILEGLAEWIGADAWLWIRWEQDRAHGWHHGLPEESWMGYLSRKECISPDLSAAKWGGDVLFRANPTHPATLVALFRGSGKVSFSQRDRAFASVILDEVAWLYRDDPVGPEDPEVRLSPRQAAIATLLLHGLGRKEIAGRLGISPNTLTSYVREIYRAFGVRSHAAFIKAYGKGDCSGPSSSR